MSVRRMMTMAVLASALAALAMPASARTLRRHHDRSLTVTRSRGLVVPPDPLVEATPNLTGRNGRTTDVNLFPDLSIGDGFYGFQSPGLDAYGLAGGGLTPYQLQ